MHGRRLPHVRAKLIDGSVEMDHNYALLERSAQTTHSKASKSCASAGSTLRASRPITEDLQTLGIVSPSTPPGPFTGNDDSPIHEQSWGE